MCVYACVCTCICVCVCVRARGPVHIMSLLCLRKDTIAHRVYTWNPVRRIRTVKITRGTYLNNISGPAADGNIQVTEMVIPRHLRTRRPRLL